MSTENTLVSLLTEKLNLIDQNKSNIDALVAKVNQLEIQVKSANELVDKINKLAATFGAKLGASLDSVDFVEKPKDETTNIASEEASQVIDKPLPKPFVKNVKTFLKITNEESLLKLLKDHFIVFVEGKLTVIIGLHHDKVRHFCPFGLFWGVKTPIDMILRGEKINTDLTQCGHHSRFDDLLELVPETSFINHKRYFNFEC